jgi:hypothetical protein
MNASDFTARLDETPTWPLGGDELGSFRWLRPGELLAFPVPTAALQLDALIRHIEIDGEFSDWSAATIHLAQARATLERLEPALAHRSNADALEAAAGVSEALLRVGLSLRAAQADELVEQARRAIALVEVIERAFE